MPAYLKSAIPPGRRPLWPIRAGGQNPKSKLSAFFYMIGHRLTQTNTDSKILYKEVSVCFCVRLWLL